MRRRLTIIALIALSFSACADPAGEAGGPEAWDEIRCADSICFGRLHSASSWVRVVWPHEFEAEPSPCEPGFGVGMCDGEDCYSLVGEWLIPYTCDDETGGLDWPAWMCSESGPIDAHPWDAAGCDSEVSSACIGVSGEAAFEILPSCHPIEDSCPVGSIGCPCGPCAQGLECKSGFCGPCPDGQIDCNCDGDGKCAQPWTCNDGKCE